MKEPEEDYLETGEQLHTQSQEDIFADEVNGEFIITRSINGMLETTEEDEECLDDVGTDNSGSPFWHAQSIHNKQTSVQKRVEYQLTNEQRSFNHRVSNQDVFIPNNAAETLRYNTTGPHALLLGGLPDVDYPTNEDNSLQLSHQSTILREEPEVQQLSVDRRTTTRRNSDSPFINQETRRNSSYSESDEMETLKESWVLSKNLKSPGLQRRRPVSTLQDPLTQTFNKDSREPSPASNSSSNNDSDYNLNTKRNSIPSGQSSNSHRVLKLGSLKPNQGMFWSIHDIVSPDPQLNSTLSESELPDLNKRSKLKSQRSTSIPNISTEGGHETLLPSRSMSTLPQIHDTEFNTSGHNLNGHSSLLEGLLERAKEKERDGSKKDRNVRTTNLSSRCPPPSPSFSTPPSPSPSDGDRETESGEKEVELTRHRASTVSEGWKEQLVDEDDDEKRNKLVFNELFIRWLIFVLSKDFVCAYAQSNKSKLKT